MGIDNLDALKPYPREVNMETTEEPREDDEPVKDDSPSPPVSGAPPAEDDGGDEPQDERTAEEKAADEAKGV